MATILVEVSEYNGKPTITLKRSVNDRYPFSFGMQKAKLIIPAIDHIKAFIEQYDTPKNATSVSVATVTVDDETL